MPIYEVEIVEYLKHSRFYLVEADSNKLAREFINSDNFCPSDMLHGEATELMTIKETVKIKEQGK